MFDILGGENKKISGYILLAVVIVMLIITLALYFGLEKKSAKDAKRVVLFYRPFCIHCQRIKPEWDKFEEMADKDTIVEKVNMGEKANRDLYAKYNIEGVPTVMMFKGDKAVLYDGDRTAEDLLKFSRMM